MILKSFKNIIILPNGCVLFDKTSYLKGYRKQYFIKKPLSPNITKLKKSIANSTFFYEKYYNPIIKK